MLLEVLTNPICIFLFVFSLVAWAFNVAVTQGKQLGVLQAIKDELACLRQLAQKTQSQVDEHSTALAVMKDRYEQGRCPSFVAPFPDSVQSCGGCQSQREPAPLVRRPGD